ncbi:FAD-binding oxidoreductase [Streptomyces sp. NA04227]|uniref:FAD-binding oxidoreductase n=1 Tax=Streptomyces sp. NA04227 TaxID=2742136 RepID=UPI001590F322|nr:FAD-binding oxidoreductase [Streptomyces sp. NA04227]QKW10274.1 FAD-binding oxidoreductase [Streptomyces sp. NA04227]
MTCAPRARLSTSVSPSPHDVALERAWGGRIAPTASWLPVAGEATGKVFHAVGRNGHGLAQAPYLGTLLADRLAGDRFRAALGSVGRERPRFAPSPVCNAPALRAIRAVDRLSDRFGSSAGWREGRPL